MVLDYRARKQYMQEYYKKNRERINARVKKYVEEHEEERRERRKERYKHNREKQIQRVIKCQKKYRRGSYAKACGVRLANYKEELENAKSDWQKKMIRKKIESARKAARTMLNKSAEKKRELAKLKRQQKYSI